MAKTGSSEETRTRTSRYVPAPHMPSECARFYDAMLRVMSGTTSVSEAARELGVARNQFQTSLHQAQAALIGALPKGRTGRPKKPEALREAESTIRSQRRALDHARWKVQKLEAQLASTSAWIRSETRIEATKSKAASPTSKPRSRRSHGSRSKTATTKTSEGSDDKPARAFAYYLGLVREGLRRGVASAAVGLAASTARRWFVHGLPRRLPRSTPRPRCEPSVAERVRALVRESLGTFGAEAIRRSVPGVSRRDVTALKLETLRRMERERRRACVRVEVSGPGIVRGFDAMFLRTPERHAYALRAQDGAVPYTTTCRVTRTYEAHEVLATLEHDFDEHGAPYALRLDRASVHRTRDIRQHCERHGVLVLHGPPCCARFYGQLERTHRDLRVFAPLEACRSIEEHASALAGARVLLNRGWRRRSLDYETAEERWNRRQVPSLDRGDMREQVREMAARIRGKGASVSDDDSHRFAVVATMIQRGLLRLVPGGHC